MRSLNGYTASLSNAAPRLRSHDTAVERLLSGWDVGVTHGVRLPLQVQGPDARGAHGVPAHPEVRQHRSAAGHASEPEKPRFPYCHRHLTHIMDCDARGPFNGPFVQCRALLTLTSAGINPSVTAGINRAILTSFPHFVMKAPCIISGRAVDEGHEGADQPAAAADHQDPQAAGVAQAHQGASAAAPLNDFWSWHDSLLAKLQNLHATGGLHMVTGARQMSVGSSNALSAAAGGQVCGLRKPQGVHGVGRGALAGNHRRRLVCSLLPLATFKRKEKSHVFEMGATEGPIGSTASLPCCWVKGLAVDGRWAWTCDCTAAGVGKAATGGHLT